MKTIKLQLLVLSIVIFSYESKSIFMSTEGSDESGDGTIGKPYLSLMKCQEEANEGDTVYIRGGTYKNFKIAKSKSSYNYIHYFNKNEITYKAYESEEVIFDFEFDTKYKIFDGGITQRVAGFMVEEGAENITFENFVCLEFQH